MTNRIWLFLSAILLIVFTTGMIINLGNIAYWEDEGETVQLGKAVLKFGYPKVFDSRSFILLDSNYRADNYARLTSPYLQFYLAAMGIWLAGTSANTFLVRLPFVMIAMLGVWASWILFNKLKFSRFSLFLYSLFVTTSVQLYLYWRQARHYALQFPLSLGLLWSYLNLHKPWGKILFLIFGLLFYHAYYPGFVSFSVAIVIHSLIRKLTDKSYRLRPLMTLFLISALINLPAFFYLKHFGQLLNNGYFQTLTAYIMDLNYIGYSKVAILSAVIIALLRFRWKFAKLPQTTLLFGLVIAIHPLLSSFGAHNQRYISVLIPYLFLIVAALWNKLTQVISQLTKINLNISRLASIPLLVWLMTYSHPKFFSEIKAFTQELRSEYYGPVEGIVNTISGIDGISRIDPNLKSRPDLLLATNFEDGAIYSYLDSQFVNMLAPTDEYKYGSRLPDWVIIRKHWGQENYLGSFLERGNYERIETDYCDLPYENVYLVRTHHFTTVTDCRDNKLILYHLKQI